MGVMFTPEQIKAREKAAGFVDKEYEARDQSGNLTGQKYSVASQQGNGTAYTPKPKAAKPAAPAPAPAAAPAPVAAAPAPAAGSPMPPSVQALAGGTADAGDMMNTPGVGALRGLLGRRTPPMDSMVLAGMKAY